jgi:hypothetical protein
MAFQQVLLNSYLNERFTNFVRLGQIFHNTNVEIARIHCLIKTYQT